MAAKPTANATPPLLAVRDLTLHYARHVAALDHVSLELFEGKTLALVGPSGSGKSSLARCLVVLERPTLGEILYRGQDLLAVDREQLRLARREIHLIFQDSASALNPGFTVQQLLDEPLSIHNPAPAQTRLRRIREVMEQVGLPDPWLGKRPLELSGGQRQRVAIARALTVQPKLLILDEALSALDVSTQGQIANLLLSLQTRHSLSYLHITHDLPMAAALAHDVVVMRSGRIAQHGSAAKLFTANLQADPASLPVDSPSRETVVGP
jgi:peptide/nickel transport system ATP-binding protein